MQVIEGEGFIALVMGEGNLWSDEIFTFEPRNEKGEVTGPCHFFNMTAMRKYITRTPGAAECMPAQMGEHHYKHIMSSNGIERAKMARLKNRPDIYCSPVIFLKWPDGSHVLADGNHRFCILWEMGITQIPAYFVKPEVWQKFQIELPQELGKAIL